MDDLTLQLMIRAADQASGPLRVVQGALGRVGRAVQQMNLQAMGESLDRAGERLGGFAANGRAAIASMMTPAFELETSLARMGVGLGSGAAETMEATRAASLAWSTEHTQNANEFVLATDAMISAGVRQQDAIAATETAMRVAAATGHDSAAIANVLGLSYRRFGREGADATEELTRMGDMFARTQQIYRRSDVSELQDPLKDVTASARLGAGALGQMLTVMGALNNEGIEGGEAGAALNAMIESMPAASRTLGFTMAFDDAGSLDLVRTIQQIETELGPLDQMTMRQQQRFQEAFGGGAQGMMLMAGHGAELVANLAEIESSTGTAADAQTAMEGNHAASMLRMQNQIDAVTMKFAEAMMPALEQLLPIVSDLVERFATFTEENPELVAMVGTVGVLAVAAASILAPMLLAAGAVVSMGAAVGATGAIIGLAVAGAVGFLAQIAAYNLAVTEGFRLLGRTLLEWMDRAEVAVREFVTAATLQFGTWVGSAAAMADDFLAPIREAMEWIENFDLGAAGTNLVDTLTAGMTAAASHPVDAMEAVVQGVRDLLPFSPAKTGPLRDLHRVQLVETLARGVRPAPLVDAMSGAASLAMASLPSALAPIPAGLFEASSPRGAQPASSATAGPMSVTFVLEGGRDAIAQIERWLLDPSNSGRLQSAVERAARQRDRTELA